MYFPKLKGKHLAHYIINNYWCSKNSISDKKEYKFYLFSSEDKCVVNFIQIL